MSHKDHGLDCNARRSEKCDCIRGKARRVRARAIKFMKRHKGKVPVIEGKVEGFD